MPPPPTPPTTSADRAGSQPWTVLSLPPLPADSVTSMLGDAPARVVVPAERTMAALLDVAGDAEVVLGDWSGQLRLTLEVLGRAGRLAAVQQPSVGVDTLDLPAFTDRGIPVANIGDANAASVAEWCLGATLDVLRSISYGDREVRAGRWPQLELTARGGGELGGRRVGIVGMGNIGRVAAQRYAALGADVAHWSRTQRPPEQAGGSRWLPFDELLAHAQVLVVLVALTPDTRGLVDEAALRRLPDGAFVVSAARGGIVDEAALFTGLRDGGLAGAALDVYATEPLPADSPLREDDRVLLSPHAAGTSAQAIARLVERVGANLVRAVTGQPLVDVVNDVDPVVRRRSG